MLGPCSLGLGIFFPPPLDERCNVSSMSQLFRKELPLQGFPHLLGAGLLQTLRDMHPPPNDLHEDQPPSWGTQEFHLVKSMSFLNSEQENSGVLKKNNSRNRL